MANKFTIWINDNVNLTGLGKVTKALGDIKAGAEKMHKAFKDGFEAGKKALDVFFAPLKAVAVPAIAAVTTAFGLAIKAIREFAGQELGEQDVVSALIAMGQYSDQYKQKLIDLASTYQTTTGIADDMWLKSIGQLTRFGMNSSNVDKVSEALKNLTGLMDGNIDTATDALAKALQGEFSMFSRFGIVVEQSGDKIKDLDKLIAEINTKGTGLLEARATTISGKWAGLKNQVNEVFEAVGQKISSSLNVGGAVDTIKAKLATVTAAVQSGGLGKILEDAGEALSKKIKDAVAWAEKIADAIKKSGKPIDEVFADALRAAAKIFVDTLTTLITASMEIWKAVGITIFTVFKDQFLKQDWPKWTGLSNVAEKSAQSTAASMSPAQADAYMTKNKIDPGYDPTAPNTPSNTRLAEQVPLMPKAQQTALATADSSAEISTAINNAVTGVKTAFDDLIAKGKTEIKAAAGMKDGKAATPEKSMITITGPDGEEITKALDEYIAELGKQAEATEKAAVAGKDSATKATESETKAEATSTSAKTASEAATKSSDEAVKSHDQIKTAMNRTADALIQAAQVAKTTEEKANQAIELLTQIAQKQANADFRLAQAESNIKSMRA